MKKNMILWLCTLVLTIAGLSSCSSDDEIEVESYDSTYDVRYYSKDPNLHKAQRRLYFDQSIEM